MDDAITKEFLDLALARRDDAIKHQGEDIQEIKDSLKWMSRLLVSTGIALFAQVVVVIAVAVIK